MGAKPWKRDTHTHTHTPENPRRKIAHSKDVKMGKKSQSAMEYLMTYGWAILIIAIVLVAFFSLNLFNPYTFAPKASPGSCQILRPNGPGSNIFVSAVGPTCTTNEIPQYVAKFNGQSSYVSAGLPTSAVVNTSISVWFLSASSTQAQTIVLLGSNGGSNGYGIYLGTGCVGGTLAILESAVRWICTGVAYTTNTWYNIALVSTPSSGNVVYDLYLDGNAVYTSPAESLPITPVSPMLIGSDNAIRNFSGSISNVQIYNTSLSQPEITALYQEGIGGAPTNIQNLVGWWPLNGNANDYSGNNNNGNAIGVTYVSSWENGYTAP